MAYAFTVTPGTVRQIGGRTHAYFEIVETDVSPSSEWNIPLGSEYWTMTLFEAHLHTVGSASQIDPDLGRAASFVVDTLDEIVQNATAGVHIRSGEDVRFVASTLYGRSKPDATAGEIRSRISLVMGHKP